MAVVTRALTPNQFKKDIDMMFMKSWGDQPEEQAQIFYQRKAPEGSSIKLASIVGLGLLRTKPESGPLYLDRPFDGYEKEVSYTTYALGVQFSEEALEDDIHGKLKMVASQLARQAKMTKEIVAISTLANSFAVTTSWDNQYLCDTDHTTKRSGATISNNGTASLSTTALQAAFQYYDTLVDEDDLPIFIRPKKLVHGPNNRFVVQDIMQSLGRRWDYADMNTGAVTAAAASYISAPTTDAPNLVRPGVLEDWKPIESHYLTIANSAASNYWWLLGEDPDNLCLNFIMKRAIKTDSWWDKHTGSQIYQISMRCAADAWDWKPIYGGEV